MSKRTNLYSNLDKLGIVEKIPMTNEEYAAYKKMAVEDLPDDIFYEVTSDDIPVLSRYPVLSDQEISNAVAACSAVNVRTIKKCVIFTTAIVAVFVAVYLVGLLVSLLSYPA